MAEQHSTVLGDEYDDALRGALLMILLEMGADLTDKSWSLGGSQVLEIIDFQLDGTLLRIEAETYMGLSITGPRSTVAEIERRLLERQAGNAANP